MNALDEILKTYHNHLSVELAAHRFKRNYNREIWFLLTDDFRDQRLHVPGMMTMGQFRKLQKADMAFVLVTGGE